MPLTPEQGARIEAAVRAKVTHPCPLRYHYAWVIEERLALIEATQRPMSQILGRGGLSETSGAARRRGAGRASRLSQPRPVRPCPRCGRGAPVYRFRPRAPGAGRVAALRDGGVREIGVATASRACCCRRTRPGAGWCPWWARRGKGARECGWRWRPLRPAQKGH